MEDIDIRPMQVGSYGESGIRLVATGAVPVPPVTYTARLIDTSSWNGTMNFAITKKKVQAVLIRAGFGNNSRDTQLDNNRKGAKANGLEYGLYWYIKAGKDFRAHAKAFYDVWKEDGGKITPTLDCEYTETDKQGTSDWIFKMDKEFQRLGGPPTMIYTGPYWWNEHCARADWPKDHDLFVAHWGVLNPSLPNDWGAIHNPVTYTMHQYSANGNGQGSAYGGGADGTVNMDLDGYHWDIPAFNREYGTNIKPLEDGSIPPPPSPVVNFPAVLKFAPGISKVNLRLTPVYPTGVVIGSISIPAEPIAFEEKIVSSKESWVRLGNNFWCARKYNGVEYLLYK